MQNKEKLCNDVGNIIKSRISNVNKTRQDIEALNHQTGMPLSMCSDYVSMRVDIHTVPDDTLCRLATYYDKITKLNLGDYFSDAEIKEYKKKYKKGKLLFPLNFEMVQVTEDQWIGSISTERLMELRDAQIIHYNEKTQRAMQRVVDGTIEVFKIVLNKNALASIRNLLRLNRFIPNTITLNIPIGEPFDYYYDSETKTLSITELDHFDILDGYHRYIALSNERNSNSAFEYPMELRITNFSEDKANQLIHQEDQKTKMKKIDSATYDQSNVINRVLQRLNTDSDFNLCGQIGLNRAIINKGEMNRAYALCQVDKIKKTEETKAVISLEQKFKKEINKLTEQDLSLLKNTWHWSFTLAVVRAILKDEVDLEIIKKNAKALSKEYRSITNLRPSKVEKVLGGGE